MDWDRFEGTIDIGNSSPLAIHENVQRDFQNFMQIVESSSLLENKET